MRIGATVAACLLAISAMAVLTLARRPLVVIGENEPQTHHTLISTQQDASACQSGETLPPGTSAIRLGLTTDLGSRVRVEVLSGLRVLASGTHAPGWEGASVTVPLQPLARVFAPVTVCFELTDFNGEVHMLGFPTSRRVAAAGEGKALPGRMHIEYLTVAGQSWWSMASAIVWRLGLGHATSGTLNAWMLLALGATLVALSSWLAIRELR